MEMSLRGKKEQSVEEVTALLNEYDADIFKKTEELRQVIVSSYLYCLSTCNSIWLLVGCLSHLESLHFSKSMQKL